MAVTDLTGTTWLWDSTIPTDLVGNSFSVNFVSNSDQFASFAFTKIGGRYFAIAYVEPDTYDYIYVYKDSGNWVYGEEYRTIRITGGTDVTNQTLIDILENYATQIIEDDTLGYVGVDGQASKITKGYVGVGNQSRKITHAYIGINNEAKKIF